MDDLEIIYEELLHIKALAHLSTMVKRELANVLVFESHAKAGTVCEYNMKRWSFSNETFMPSMFVHQNGL